MEILKKRVGNDLVMRLTISDSGILLDWSDVTVISAHMYSDGARITAGRCRWSLDPDDHTILVVTYGPDEPQYLGYNRLVLSCEYRGHTATYDHVVVNYVPLTEMEGTETVADVAVSLSTGEMTEGIAIAVESISSSVIGQLIDDTQEAKEQALAAADRANSISDDLSTFRPEVERALSERVRYADVVDGLESTETDKPLSANQGRVLKEGKQDKTSLVSDLATKVNALSSSDKAAFLGQIGAASEESLKLHENDNTRHITADERAEWNAKQDTISDLATIRSGASKGATALQSYTETDPIYTADKPSLALKTEIPDVSGKADKTAIVTETEGSASYAISPNVLTKLGTLASSVTLSLDTSKEDSGVTNVYDIIFVTPTDAPSITWPEGITWVGGSAPTIAGGKTYEVSIMDNLATYGEY